MLLFSAKFDEIVDQTVCVGVIFTISMPLSYQCNLYFIFTQKKLKQSVQNREKRKYNPYNAKF